MASFERIFVLDGGGTKTAAVLYDVAGKELTATVVGPCNVHQDPHGGLIEIERAWRVLCAETGLDPEFAPATTCVSGGLAGVSNVSGRTWIAANLRQFSMVLLSGDGYTALVGAFDGQPGALLSIGTGVVGYRLYNNGTSRRFSGWGFPAGDRGGGAWLGWRLVADWLEARDGHPAAAPSARLTTAVGHLLGNERAVIVGRLRSMTPADYATLARPLLAEAALGEPYATAIVDEAAVHNLRLARTLRPTRSEPLALVGGLALTFAGSIAAGLPPGSVDTSRAISPLRGAWLIGIGRASPEYPNPD